MFFTEEIIETFRETPDIKAYLSSQKKRLIHSQEIIEFIKWTPVAKNLSRRIPSHLMNSSQSHTIFSKVKKEDHQYGMNTLIELISKWTLKICGDSISDGYGSGALFQAAVMGKEDYDVIFVVDDDYREKLKENYTSHSELVKDKLKFMHSVMIVQKGECENRPKTVAIKLICSTRSMKANILMGAYLYTIKHTPSIDQIGILELAGGFKNLQGYCLYTKFGFVADKSLYVPVIWDADKEEPWEPDMTDKDLSVPNPTYYNFKNQSYTQKRKCFGDQGNLAMSVDLNHITEKAIIKTTTQNKPIHKVGMLHSANPFPVPKPQDLCTTLKGSTEEENKAQMAIADLYSKVHNAELDIENNVYNTGQVIQGDHLQLRKQKVDVFKQHIKALRSTFRQNPRSNGITTPSFFRTRKSTPKEKKKTTSSHLGSHKLKTRSRSISPHIIKSKQKSRSRSSSPYLSKTKPKSLRSPMTGSKKK